MFERKNLYDYKDLISLLYWSEQNMIVIFGFFLYVPTLVTMETIYATFSAELTISCHLLYCDLILLQS